MELLDLVEIWPILVWPLIVGYSNWPWDVALLDFNEDPEVIPNPL